MTAGEGGDGPFLTAAVICERVITEQDGAMTAVRIIDRVTFPADPVTAVPLNPIQHVWFLIMLKAGGARGRYKLEIIREKPSGLSDPILTTPVLLEGEDRGANVVINAAFQPEEEGLYWFDVMFSGGDDVSENDRRRLTRVPLRAVFQPLQQAFQSPSL